MFETVNLDNQVGNGKKPEEGKKASDTKEEEERK